MGNTASESGDKAGAPSPGGEGGRFSIKALVKADTLRDARAWVKGEAPGWFRRLSRKRRPSTPAAGGRANSRRLSQALLAMGLVCLASASILFCVRSGGHLPLSRGVRHVVDYEFSVTSARYLLSAEAQVLAAILAVCGTGYLVVAQMVASAYGPRVSVLLLRNRVLVFLIPYAVGVCASLVLLLSIPESGTDLQNGTKVATLAVTGWGLGCVALLVVIVPLFLKRVNATYILQRFEADAALWVRGKGTEESFQASLDISFGALDKRDFRTAEHAVRVLGYTCAAFSLHGNKEDFDESLRLMLAGIADVIRRHEEMKGPQRFYEGARNLLALICTRLDIRERSDRVALLNVDYLHGNAKERALKESLFDALMRLISLRQDEETRCALLNRSRAALFLAKLRKNWSDKPVDWKNEPAVHAPFERLRQDGFFDAECERMMYAAGVFYSENRKNPSSPLFTRATLPSEDEVNALAEVYEKLKGQRRWEEIEGGKPGAVKGAVVDPGTILPEFVRGWASGYFLKAFGELEGKNKDEQQKTKWLEEVLANRSEHFAFLRFLQSYCDQEQRKGVQQMELVTASLKGGFDNRIRTLNRGNEEQVLKCAAAIVGREEWRRMNWLKVPDDWFG